MSATPVYRVVLSIVDHDRIGPQSVIDELENANYANDCIYPNVRSIEAREVEWSDDHPLNRTYTSAAAFDALFASPAAPSIHAAEPDVQNGGSGVGREGEKPQ